MRTHLLNGGPEAVKIEALEIGSTDGKNWNVHEDSKPSPSPSLEGGKDALVRFALKVPEDAPLTRPYYSRPDEEQPYYNLDDRRFENLSHAPYPLGPTARISYRGTE